MRYLRQFIADPNDMNLAHRRWAHIKAATHELAVTNGMVPARLGENVTIGAIVAEDSKANQWTAGPADGLPKVCRVFTVRIGAKQQTPQRPI